MEIVCDKKYMILPASFAAPKKRITFAVDGTVVYDLLVGLDTEEPEFRFPVNLERFAGQTLTMSVDCDRAFEPELTDDIEERHDGKYRPWLHFTAGRGWINDPNGLIYYKGKYHMFFQHNPAATTWENMHWGSAESTDLIHWQETGDVLFPDENGTIFSGSGLVDVRNVSGLKTGAEDPILLFYTAAGHTSVASQGKKFTQRLAYSVDGGKTFVKYPEPVIDWVKHENRDPKIIYYASTDSYVMPIFLDEHEYAIFTSKDLFHWQELQRLELPEDWECPDFYPLFVDGDPDRERWIFSGASDRYYVGRFDGQRFTPETELLRLNYGNASYAAQSWSELPGGRRVRTAFANIVIPGMPFGCCMDVPQKMSLKTVQGQLRLCAEPVAELEGLKKQVHRRSMIGLEAEQVLRLPIEEKACYVKLSLTCEADVTLSLFGLDIVYDKTNSCLRCLDCEAPVKGKEGVIELRVIYDTIYAELFAEEGSVYMGLKYQQDLMRNHLTIRSDSAEIQTLEAMELSAYYAE